MSECTHIKEAVFDPQANTDVDFEYEPRIRFAFFDDGKTIFTIGDFGMRFEAYLNKHDIRRLVEALAPDAGYSLVDTDELWEQEREAND